MNYSGARPFTDAEIVKVLGAYGGRYAKRDRLLLLFGVHTGYRIKETLSIKVSDVFDGVKVLDEVCVKKGYMKGKVRNRTMPLHSNVREGIAVWLEVYLRGLSNPLERPLFPRQRTMFAMTRSQAANILIRATAEAGVDVRRVSTHTGRKSFARKMWNSPQIGHDMAKMAHLLGHRNFSNTLKYLEFTEELDAAILTVE
jgi:site-specific recombinase XerD